MNIQINTLKYFLIVGIPYKGVTAYETDANPDIPKHLEQLLKSEVSFLR